MPISRSVDEALASASWIRRMFEQGLLLKGEHGAENVADLALGNPTVEPPAEVMARLRDLAADETPGTHRYMPNAGLPGTREAIAAYLARETGLPYTLDNVVMTVGAGGGMVLLLKAIVDPGDEVIVLAPFFVEYLHYVSNFGGRTVAVDTDERFRPDPEAVARAITSRTRAVVVNSPNNPTGVVYGRDDLDALGRVLEEASSRYGRPIQLISDEPYRAITYDDVEVPWPVRSYANTIHATSFSKDLALPGERIGYVAVNPEAEEAGKLHGALVFCMRALGYVNAPALQQRWVQTLIDVKPDLRDYAAKRARLLDALETAGYDVVRPDGAFYIFPTVPGSGDDIAFTEACLKERLLVVPGTGFGRPGYFRISYAVTDRDVDLALDALGRVATAF